MDLEYTSSDGLIGLIKQINDRYYERLNANILYLEEQSDKIYVVYIIELRDAYSHLVRLFDHDILSVEGKKHVQNHLGEYVYHLQRGLLDTFRKILALEVKMLTSVIHRHDIKAAEYQIAQEAHKLRIMGKEDSSIDERINGYLKLMDYISAMRKKFMS